jgi:hypothetical protein
VWGRFEVSEGGEGSKDGEFVYGSEEGEGMLKDEVLWHK